MTNSDFTIYGKAEYYRDLIARIDKAGPGEHVAVATMNFEPLDAGVPALIDALCTAAGRGADVRFSIDAYNFLSSKNKLAGPTVFTGKLPKHALPFYRQKLAALERLRACGGKYTITNMPTRAFTSPFASRSHIKYAVVNDYVYVGGCNISKTDVIDVMVGWRDATTAAWLLEFARDVDTAGSVRAALRGQDVTRAVDQQTELLIDAGVRDQSVIYQRALELIDQAEQSVYITCQFFPNSETTRHLVRAHQRGAEITIVFNHPIKHGAHYPLQQAVVWRERTRTPKVFFAHQLSLRQHYLHAKLIATEKGAIIGSHNYVRAGINWGTAEIALLRRDPGFALAAIEAIKTQIKQKHS